MIIAFVAGLLMSFVGSITPAGPIALIVLKRGLSRQSLSALALAGGAALAEAGYALLAYLGINFAFSRYPVQASVLRIIVGALLIAFAALCIWDGGSRRPRNSGGEYAGANFLLGLSIAGLNPTYLVTWAGAVAIARSAGLVLNLHSAPAFALGVVVGPILWFWVLLRILTRHVERFRPEVLGIIEKILPIALLALAGVILAQAFIPLMRR